MLWLIVLIRSPCSSLYRRSLKLALDWTVDRGLWRGQALYIRSLFEANRQITNPRQQRVRTTIQSRCKSCEATELHIKDRICLEFVDFK